MKLRAVFAALVAFGAACAAPTAEAPPSGLCGRVFVVSLDFTEEERAAINSAVIRWNEIAKERFCTRLATPEEVPWNTRRGIFKIQYKGSYWQMLSEQHGGLDIWGIHFGRSDLIGIIDALSIDAFEVVALHEFGHAHGLNHIAAPGIMHDSAGTATDFTPNDLAECVRVGACVARKEDSNGGE